MPIPDNLRKSGVHMIRGLAYICFPVGVLITADFLLALTLETNQLYTLSVWDVLIDLCGIVLFFTSMGTILFLHPQKASGVSDSTLATRNLKAKIRYYLPHVVILIFLAIVGFGLLLLYFFFMAAALGG